MRLFSLIVLSIVLCACADSGTDEHDSPGSRGTEDKSVALEARSDLLRNPDDNCSRIVFDPELRGKTDRLVLRFRKDGTRR